MTQPIGAEKTPSSPSDSFPLKQSHPFALHVREVTMNFGGLKALTSIDLQVKQGQIFGLIGPNGAGKTTLFNLLTGVYPPSSGSIHVFGQSTSGLKTSQITRLGVARTFQNIRLFKDLSVLDHLLISFLENPQQKSPSWFDMLFRGPRFDAILEENLAAAEKLLEYFHLLERREDLARNLPYGDQRRLEIARALATGAKLLLLDEPAAGMNPEETFQLTKVLRGIRDDWGTTLLLIEHDMRLVMNLCEQIAVLDYGVKIADDIPEKIQKNSSVIEAYLGKPKEGNKNT